MPAEKIILAYSGGLDTSVAIKWLKEHYGYDVVAVAADVGEGKDLKQIKEKALQIGAISSHVADIREEFANDYLQVALKSNALYEGVYPLVSALSRPLIAKLLVKIAQQENAVAIAHGCTGKGNDQVRFDIAINTLAPNIKIVAPVRENPMSREAAIQYAEDHHIPLPSAIKLNSPYSIDQNLWGRSCECGALEDPWAQPPSGAYELTQSIEDAPDQAETVEIEFKQGCPISLNGEPKSFVDIIESLNKLAGKHGVGRIDHIENRLIGIKSREVYEAPAAMTLINAHQALEAITLTRDVAHFKPILEQQMAKLIYEGMWFSPLHKAVQAFIDKTQETVNGTVRLKLFKGHATVTGRKSSNSLYQYELATYNPDDQFDHQAALGFIKLFGLPLEVHAKVNGLKT